MKKFFKYIEPLWTGKDKKISLRNLAAMALIIDFIINVHNSANMVSKILRFIEKDKVLDATLISSMSGNLAQIAMILLTEASLIAALLALRTWQNSRDSIMYQQAYQQPNQQGAITPGIENVIH